MAPGARLVAGLQSFLPEAHMPRDKKEGDVGQTVNRQKGNPNSQHSDFYESRRDSAESGPHQGGHVSDYQAAEGVRPSPPVGQEDVADPPKVKTETGGARRESF